MPRSYNSTSPLAYRQKVRFALFRFRSPLLPESRLISFPPGTKMLQFPGSPAPHGAPLNGAGFPFRDPGVDACMRLTQAYRRLPRPSSASRAEPSTRWLSVARLQEPTSPMAVSSRVSRRQFGPHQIGC